MPIIWSNRLAATASAAGRSTPAISPSRRPRHCCDLFVGSDSGPLNLATAVGTPAFGLFGPNRVLTYSKFIHPVLPDDGHTEAPDRLQHISAAAVLARIEPYLCAQSA